MDTTNNNDREATYGEIISPEAFNEINTKQHLYVRGSDALIRKFIRQEVQHKPRILEAVEIGCGPARLLESMIAVPGINLTGIDHDPIFVKYAQEKLGGSTVQLASIETYQHSRPVDLFYSQGVHHHLAKPPRYLDNVTKQLTSGGIYIVSDEFLPNYSSEEERQVRTTIWHAHIISHALRKGYLYLAQEEAKILLDDLTTALKEKRIKTPSQIELVLSSVTAINNAAIRKEKATAETLADKFLQQLEGMSSQQLQGDPTLDLSRGDYKICDRVFREEIKQAGFRVEEARSIGQVQDIGGFMIYILRTDDIPDYNRRI